MRSQIVWLFVIAFYSILKLLIIWARSRSFKLTPFCCWNKCNGIGWRARKNTFNVLVYYVLCFVRSFAPNAISSIAVCVCIDVFVVSMWYGVSVRVRVCVLVYMCLIVFLAAAATTIHRNVLHLYRIELFFWIELFVFNFLMHTHTLNRTDLSPSLSPSSSIIFLFVSVFVFRMQCCMCARV